MTIKNFIKLQAFALLFTAIISPSSVLAGANEKPVTIEFALGTYEVTGPKAECAPSYFGGNITGMGTGSITANGKSESLGVLTLTADDCITPVDATHFSAKGNVTLTAGNGNNIMANYSVTFVPTDTLPIYKYENFTLQITGGTGRFKGVSGSGTADGTSNIVTGLGFVEGIINMSK
ncbi:conserved exported hypothetical protein [Candidatus Nitrotoga sp. HW29]|uniref:hypothetical protein n=1 Tax=Candidatus Nitrotoga sp. HW29 TaxID=2886963 RepID=UPI001EF39F11|nr:hypothetical protein [Candidatus Nitrotoga sp. HW29]CAH1903376.1 conserved exported hypothetical protein [Candidatus Nitrotoga sp. HW29]